MDIDIRKIALYLSWKLPPYYGNSKRLVFIRQLRAVAPAQYTNDEISFIDQQTRNDDEKFFIEILEDQKQSSEEIFDKIIEGLGLPPDVVWIITVEQVESQETKKEGEDLIWELKIIPKWKDGYKQFEVFWEKLVKFLLQDSFEKFSYEPQVNNLDSTDIRDGLLLNIPRKDNALVSIFWENIVQRIYGSIFVTFEYKNYTDTAGQTILYTTAKYLEKVNIWRFGIIFAREWVDGSAQKKQLDYFRGSSEKKSICFLVLDDADIINLIEIKINWGIAEEYFMKKFLELNWLV